MENYTRFIEAFQRIFVATMVFLIVLAGLVGWFMARRALSGLGEVARTAQYISGGALDERVPVKPRGDEIDQLATTFNKMLDRIQNLVIGIREMSDNMAHDLKSPVTRIRGIAEITLTTETSLKGYQNMAASTIEECDRLLDMINTMLLISKTEAGAGKIEYQKMDMASIVRDACDLFQPLAEDKGISMTCNVHDKFTFYGDIRMVQRMIANLLDNAIKYTPSDGPVAVSVHSDDRRSVVVSVRDTGVGISPKDIPHIFERFYRCDPSRPQTGIGLGLSLAQAIAHAHGGNIVVISIPDKGSTFTVTLPISPESSK
jgi:heavy metal sensor kinase